MITLHFICKCKLRTLIKIEHLCSSFKFSKKCLIPVCSYRTKSSSFTISYLKNICGLSGKSLVRASNLISFESSERPNSVLELIQGYGFSETHISKIIARYTRLLLLDAQKSLKPKLDFLFSISNSETQIIKVVIRDPNILSRDLNNHLIPLFNLLIRLMGSRQNAVAALGGSPSILTCSIPSLVHNVGLLRALGVSYSQIVKMVNVQFNALSRSPEKFRNVVLKVNEMGFNLSSASFRHAVSAMITSTESKWESKLQTFRTLGFSNDDIHSMFKKQPLCLNKYEDNIRKVVGFYLTELFWSPSKLSAMPSILLYSLEKRIIPRCSVLQTLVSRNRISINLMLTTILQMSERKFLETYVTKHKDEVPELLDAYQGKLRFDEYNFHLVGKKQDAAL